MKTRIILASIIAVIILTSANKPYTIKTFSLNKLQEMVALSETEIENIIVLNGYSQDFQSTTDTRKWFDSDEVRSNNQHDFVTINYFSDGSINLKFSTSDISYHQQFKKDLTSQGFKFSEKTIDSTDNGEVNIGYIYSNTNYVAGFTCYKNHGVQRYLHYIWANE